MRHAHKLYVKQPSGGSGATTVQYYFVDHADAGRTAAENPLSQPFM